MKSRKQINFCKGYLHYIFLFFLCLGCTNSKDFSEDKKRRDSIDYYLKKSFNFKLSDQEIALTTAKAHRLIKQTKIDSLYIINNFFVSYAYDNIGEKKLCRNINSEMVEVAKKLNDSINLARAYNHIGDSYCKGLNSDSAFFYYIKAEKIYLKAGDNLGVGKINLKMANEKYYLKDYFGCEKSAVVASSYFRFEKNLEQMFETYNLLGITSIETDLVVTGMNLI